MPLVLPDYVLSESMQTEYRALTENTEHLTPVARQRRINRLLHQMKQGYHEYLTTILFPREAYVLGVFALSTPSFKIERSTQLCFALCVSAQGFSKDNIAPHAEHKAWQDHWLRLSDPIQFADVQSRSDAVFFTHLRHQERSYSPDEQHRYVAAICAFRKYSSYSAELKQLLQDNLALKPAECSSAFPDMYDAYEQYNTQLQTMNVDTVRATLTAAQVSANAIIQALTNKRMADSNPDEVQSAFNAFTRIHNHNTGVLEAHISTQEAFAQLAFSRNVTKAIALMSAAGLFIAALTLGLAYFNVIALALTICHYLYGLIAISSLGYGYAMSRMLYFNHHHVNNNLPPLEALDRMPREDLARETLVLISRHVL